MIELPLGRRRLSIRLFQIHCQYVVVYTCTSDECIHGIVLLYGRNSYLATQSSVSVLTVSTETLAGLLVINVVLLCITLFIAVYHRAH